MWIKYYSRSRSRSFPRMEASDSLSRTLGMDFFIPFPFPNFGNGFFSFPSRSRILGMGFFHSLPIPEIWEWIFLFPSRSRISGIGFFNSLPVPELREWAFSIPFPFPNPQKSFLLTPGWWWWCCEWWSRRHGTPNPSPPPGLVLRASKPVVATNHSSLPTTCLSAFDF